MRTNTMLIRKLNFNNQKAILKACLFLFIFILSTFALMTTVASQQPQRAKQEFNLAQISPPVGQLDNFNQSIFDRPNDPYSNIYNDLGINQNDLVKAFNSKAALLPQGSRNTSNTWVDDFNSRDLNKRWRFEGNGSSYKIQNGKLISSLDLASIGGSTAYSILELTDPIREGDFEIETKFNIQTAANTAYFLVLYEEYNATSNSFGSWPFTYLAYGEGNVADDIDNIAESSFGGPFTVASIDNLTLLNQGIRFKISYTSNNDTYHKYYRTSDSLPWIAFGTKAGLKLTTPRIGIYSQTSNSTFIHNLTIDYLTLRSTQQIPVIKTLRDNENSYQQVWEPWLTKAAVHKATVSESGDLLAIAGGYLLDTELHIYRWDYLQRKYVKAFEAGSGVIQGDVYDLTFGDSDNNRLTELAAASADGHVYLFEQNHLYDPNTNLESKFDLVWQSGAEIQQQVSTVDFYDADLDLIQDLIVGSYDRKIHIYEYTNHSGYPFTSIEHKIDLTEKWVSPELDDAILSVASGDFNNNGLPDFVVGTRSGSIYIFENAGLVVDVRGAPTLLPWDNNYKLIYSFTGKTRPVWYPVTKIESGNIDNTGGDEAVLLAWGQGTFALHYNSLTKEFFLEQIVKKYASWETKLPYPLDNYVDWIESAQNVWHNINGTTVYEPACCDVELNVNGASGYAPDAKYSHFSPTSNQNASATYALWEGELLATSANTDPDLYVILHNSYPVSKDLWSVSVSQDKLTWFDVDQKYFSETAGTNGKTLAIDLDPTFALEQISFVKYIKLTLAPGSSEKQVDALFYPRAYRPLTTTTSAMIRPLKVSTTDSATANKITFGTVDGRFLTYKFDTNKADFDYQTQTGQDLYIKYQIAIPHYSEQWDSYEDDNYNLKTTIWDIAYTPKGRYIPSWRFDASSGTEFTQADINHWEGPASTRLHSFDIYPVYFPAADAKIAVTTNNSLDSADKIILLSNTDGKRAKTISAYDLSTHFFTNVNNQYTASATINELLTISFGDIFSSGYGKELLVFPWYNDGRPFLTAGTPSYADVTPRIFSRSYYFSAYNSGTNIDAYMASGELAKLQTFITSASTFPSGTFADLDNDGLTDIIISNGTLAVLWNRGTATSPSFYFDFDYFNGINGDLVESTIFQPQAWDYDRDGDFDIAFSYNNQSNPNPANGFDFFELKSINSRGDVTWKRNIQIIENPSRYGSLISNKYTLGKIIPSTSCDTATIFQTCTSAEAFWVYSPYQDPGNGFNERLRKLTYDITSQTSFIVGTNPYVMKVEANLFNEYPNSINMGYSLTASWSNEMLVKDWTRAVSTSDLDADGKREVIVGDFDNNIYVFEHLSNNTYKRAFKSQNLNHTEKTNLSPYLWEDLAGISGNFSRIVYDHTNFIASGVDFNNDGLEGFVVTSGNTVYVYEATGYNDEVSLFLQFEIGDLYQGIAGFDQESEEITALAVTKDFDGRGSIIAVAINNKLFMFRLDDKLGLVDSFAFYEREAGYQLPGNPFAYPNLVIQTLIFADMNKDGITELWLGGIDSSTGTNAFLSALSADTMGNLYLAYDFDTSLTYGKTINAITTADVDLDNNLEIVIAHSLGVDIYEFTTGKPLSDVIFLDAITSDPTYASGRLVTPVTVPDIVKIKAIAVGDTDQDLRSEIIVSHGLQVSLFEVDQDSYGKVSHKWVWTSKEFNDRPNSIAIDDVNGNGWQEIFFAVQGDDVYAFEIANTEQPQSSSNFLTELSTQTSIPDLGPTDIVSRDSITIDNTTILTEENSGIIAWDVINNNQVWTKADPFNGKSEFLFKHKDSIVVISTGGVYSFLPSDRITIIHLSGESASMVSSFVITGDSLVVGYKNNSALNLKGIVSINLNSGSINWQVNVNVAPGSSVYDMKAYINNNTVIYTASISDFSTFKKVVFFDENGALLYQYDASYIDTNPGSSRSTIGDFNGDSALDIATATTDTQTHENKLTVRSIEDFSIIYELNLKDLGGTIYERLPLFTVDTNNDSSDEIALIIAKFNSSDTSTYLLDNPGYKNSLLAIVDITVPRVVWQRQINDAISNIEQLDYNNDTIFVVYTDNFGVFGVGSNGADVFWAEGSQLATSATVSDTHITVSTLNGIIIHSEFKGLLKRADNFVIPRPFIGKSIGTKMFSATNVLKTIPIDIFDKGSQELLVAFTNGSLKLFSYLSGEIMSINTSNVFKHISAATLYYDLNKFGFIIATDTNNLLIFDRSSNIPEKSIITPGPVVGDVLTFNMTGKSVDSILIQTKQAFGYMLSIYDLTKERYVWNRTYANKITNLYLGNFDGSEVNRLTHIVSLDDNGVAKLIELPNVFLGGGDFIMPDLGRWTKLQVTQNTNGLTDVYLGSNYGQIFKFSWDLSGSYSIDKFNAKPLGSGQSPKLHITEVMYQPPTTHPDAEWVELFNPTDKAISLESWFIRDYGNNRFYLSGIIPSGGYLVVTKDNTQFESLYGFKADLEWKNDAPLLEFGQATEGVFIYFGTLLIDVEYWGWSSSPNLYDITTSVGTTLLKNTTKNHIAYTNTEFIDSGTVGTPKNGPYNTKLLISEVFYKTGDSNENQQKGEWIELYNPSSVDVDLSSWYLFSALTSMNIPLTGVIKANDYFVLVNDVSTFSNLYGFNPDMVFSSSMHLTDTGDLLTLYNPEGVNIDKVGWENYNSVAESNIVANSRESIQRKTIIDTDNAATDFETTGGYGTPGFGLYSRLYKLLAVQQQDISDNKVLTMVTSDNELLIMEDNNVLINSTQVKLNKSYLAHTYDSSIVSNIDNSNLDILIPFGNMLLVKSMTGADIEFHSFNSEIVSVIAWNIDKKENSVVVVGLQNGDHVLIDPTERFAGCYYDASTCSKNQKPKDIYDLGFQGLFDQEFDKFNNANVYGFDYIFKEFLLGILVIVPISISVLSTLAIKRRRRLLRVRRNN